MKMVKKADVDVENFRPDVKRRLKIDYKDVKKVNPRIVYWQHLRLSARTGPTRTGRASTRSPRAWAG